MSRSLWPREHGAYAQLLAPLITALVEQPPTLAAGLLAIAACCAFLANEPLLVVLGHRGKRLREQAGRRATWRLALLVIIAIGAGAAGFVLAPSALRAAALVAPVALVTIALAFRRGEHSLVGELVAAIALSGGALPVAIASGATLHRAIALWAAWGVGFACSVIAVHRVIARNRRAASWRDGIAALACAGVIGAAIAVFSYERLAMCAIPLAALSLVLVARPPRATHLRKIGVALVVAALATSVLGVSL